MVITIPTVRRCSSVAQGLLAAVLLALPVAAARAQPAPPVNLMVLGDTTASATPRVGAAPTASATLTDARKPNTDRDAPLLQALRTQVALTRAGFSVGAIDGQAGPKTRKALAAAGRGVSMEIEPLQEYVVAAEDVAGPFEPAIPEDMMEKGKLEALSYASIGEMLAERFRTTVPLLERLNPGVAFTQGAKLRVPNVEPMEPPALAHLREVAEPAAETTGAVRVSKAGRDLKVVDASGAIRFYAPVSSGSDKDPLPIGEWKVVNVFLRPVFNYNPDLFWDADPAHAKTQLPGGPNNPVGLVWIELDKEHYGLHGTPVPETIGVTQSHGCVRLTNWDALHLATLVKPGTPVIFEP